MYQINEKVLILPTEDHECEVGSVTKTRSQTTSIDGKTEHVELYTVGGLIYEGSNLVGVGETFTVLNHYGESETHTLKSFITFEDEGTTCLVLDENSIISPQQLYYCSDCEAIHICYADDDHDFDGEATSFGHFLGYAECLSDVIDYLTNVDESIMEVVLNNNFDGDLLEDHRYNDSEFIENFYQAIMDYKETQKHNDVIPQYTHEELVELIGHEFAMKE